MSQMSKEYKLKWAREHPESRSRSIKKYLEIHPERRKKTTRKYYLLHKDCDKLKLDARIAVREGIRKGLLIRPKTCSRCGKECTPHGHHHKGYEREHWLNVIWLCLSCHTEEHRCQ